MNLKKFFDHKDKIKSNRDWKEKNKKYLNSMQKFLDATDRIKDESLKKHIIIQMLKCDMALTEIAEREIQKAKKELV